MTPVAHTFRSTAVGAPIITYYTWGDVSKPRVLLIHATGFHGRCWQQVAALLAGDFHVIAIDLRGHGNSDNVGPFTWPDFAGDVRALTEHLGLESAVAVGHSMGAYCAVLTAAAMPRAFNRLILADPVIMEPVAYAEDRVRGFETPEQNPVARRRNTWRDWQEMFDRFSTRHPFSRWQPGVLEDYCRFGLVPADNEKDGWQLACPPIIEATVYHGNSGADPYQLIDTVDIPVTILRAPPRNESDVSEMDFSKSPTWPGLAGRFKNGRDVFLEENTHFIPMESPDLIARFVRNPQAQG